MSDDYSGYSVAKLKGKLQNEELPALREAGLIPADEIDYLENYRSTYDPYQAQHYKHEDKDAYFYFNSQRYVRKVRRCVGKTLSKAVENGNISIIQHAIGLAEQEKEDADFVEYKRLENLLERDGLMLNILGPRNGGKSNSMYRLMEFLLEKYDDAVFAVNEPSVAELHERITFCKSDREALIWAVNHPNKEKWVFLDEMTTKLSYRDGTAYDAEVANEIGTKFRKAPLDLNWVNVYHDISDPAPIWREGDRANFMRKEGNTIEETQKTAVFYEKCTDASLEEPQFEFYGIKETQLGYDTDINPTWEWVLDKEEFADIFNNPEKYREEEDEGPPEVDFEDDYDYGDTENEDEIHTVVSLRKEGFSLDKIADITNTPKSTVSYWVRNHMNDD